MDSELGATSPMAVHTFISGRVRMQWWELGRLSIVWSQSCFTTDSGCLSSQRHCGLGEPTRGLNQSHPYSLPMRASVPDGRFRHERRSRPTKETASIDLSTCQIPSGTREPRLLECTQQSWQDGIADRRPLCHVRDAGATSEGSRIQQGYIRRGKCITPRKRIPGPWRGQAKLAKW